MRVLRISHSAVVSEWRERERELRRRGVEVELLSARVWNEGGHAVRFSADGDGFARPVTTVGRHPNVFLFDPVPVWRALRRGWDVVDIHEEPCSLAAAEVLLLRVVARSRAPFVLYSAQNIDKRYPVPFRWFERHALRRAGGVSVCNAEAGRIVARKGLRGPAARIPLGVDLGAFRPGDRAASASAGFRIGYVGRLEPHKGVHVVIDALAQLSDAVLEVIGAGPGEADLRRRVAARGVDARVCFTGPLDAPRLAEAYRSLDVLVVPSLPTSGWQEQFGRVAVEAMASGVPVVASRSGALPDVVGDAGVLVEPGDVDAWAAALAALRDAPQRRDALRAAGLQRAASFTWSAVAADMTELYRAVAGRAPVQSVPATRRGLEVVVVAYGPADKLDRALGALGAPGAGFALTVVDNSSSRATAEVVHRHGGRYHDPGANLGFAAAVNYALERRSDRSRDVLLLNPDAEIAPTQVRLLHDVLAADPGVAAVAPAQVGLDGRPDRVEWPFPTPARAWLEAAGLGRLDTGDAFLIGSVLLIRSEALRDVGPFDERFFLYSEETDWQRRATARGWRLQLVPAARAVHEGAGTSSDPLWRTLQFTASLELYVRKHSGALGWQLFRLAGILGAAARGLVLRGARRSAARQRLAIYVRGPVRRNRTVTRPGPVDR